MGSAKVSISKSQKMENKSFKPISMLKSFFHIDKKKEKSRDKLIDKQNESKTKSTHKKHESTNNNTESTHKGPEATVASIMEPFKKLEIETIQQDDERDNFTIKVIEEDGRSNRIDSQSSEDSGFADNDAVELEKLTHEGEEVQKAKEETEAKKKTKKVMVVVKRTPIRNKVDYSVHPYAKNADTSKPVSNI